MRVYYISLSAHTESQRNSETFQRQFFLSTMMHKAPQNIPLPSEIPKSQPSNLPNSPFFQSTALLC